MAVAVPGVFFVIFLTVSGVLGAPYGVKEWDETFTDPARPSHRIPTKIFYPVASSSKATSDPFPLICFAHCYLGGDSWYQYIVDELVPDGYVMAIVGSEHYDPLSSPKHLALDQAYLAKYLQKNAGSHGFAVSEQIAAMGHSEGGAASMLALSLYPFKSMATLSGGWLPDELQPALENITVPALMLAGTADCLVPHTMSHMFYGWISNETCKFFVDLVNATHCHFDQIGKVLDEACHLVEDADFCQHGLKVISAQEQFDLVKKYLHYWVDYSLKGNHVALESLVFDLANDKGLGKLSWESQSGSC